MEGSGDADAAPRSQEHVAGPDAPDATSCQNGKVAVDCVPEDWKTRGIFATVDPEDTETFDRLCKRVDTRLHEAARAHNLAALEKLLAAGAERTALDWEGRTPLHLCVAYRLLDPLKVLLRDPGFANVRDASELKVLDAALLHGWRDGARAVLDAGATVGSGDSVPTSIYTSVNRYPDIELPKFCSALSQSSITLAMESGDMELFEMILNKTVREHMLDMPNGSWKTPLICAIEDNNLPAIQALLNRGASLHRVEHCKTTVLHAAVHDHNILKYLINYPGFTSTLFTALDDEGHTPLHAAVIANNPESVRLLIDHYKDKRVKTDDRMEATPLHCAVYYGSYEAAKVILERDLLEAMKETDKNKDTPLVAAARYSSRKIAELLLENGGLLSTKDTKGVTVLELISKNFFEASNFFEHLFHKFVLSKNFDTDVKVTVDYKVLTNKEGMPQIHVLEEFVRCGQSKVLIHPLIESLLYLNWIQFLPLFYALVTLYATFLVSVNVFFISAFYQGDKNDSRIKNNGTFKMPEPGEFPAGAEVYWLLIVLMCGTISLLLLQELFSVYVKRWSYFRSGESWVKLSGLVLCASTPPLAMLVPDPWPRHVACAALILAWLQAMFLVSRLLGCGYYALMLGKVALNMLKILATTTCLIIGFAVGFLVQYRWAPPFDDPFVSVIKTIVMMSSELDYENLFDTNHEQLANTRTIVRILLLIFLIFMGIVLMNFMTAVAVDDISDLNKVGNIKRVEKQIALLSCLDYLVHEGLFAKWLKKKFGDKRYKVSMHTFRWNPTWYVLTPAKPCPELSLPIYAPNRIPYVAERCSEYEVRINSSRLYNRIIETTGRNEQRVETEKHNADKEVCKLKLDALYNAIVDNPVIGDKKLTPAKKKNDSATLEEQINTLFSEISKVTGEIGELKGQLSVQSTAILTILKKIELNRGGTANVKSK